MNVMKQFDFLVLLIGSIACFSCSDDISTCENSFKNNSCQDQGEIALPNKPKDIITLSNGVQLAKCDSIYILDGDIILSKEQLASLNSVPQTKSAYITALSKRWPGNVIFYTMSSGFYDTNTVQRAINHIETNTSIRFWTKVDGISDYVSFVNGDGNFSYVGKMGGMQLITIYKNSGMGTVVHEIGHALGLFHEHNRADRDSYVTINWGNIKKEWQYAYKKYTDEGYQGSDLGSFDFNSIMLYSSINSFAVDISKPTMTRKNGTTFSGQRDGLSNGDIAGVNRMYGTTAPNDIIYFTREWDENSSNMGRAYLKKYVEYTFVTRLPVQKDEIIYISLYEEGNGSGQEYYPPYEHTEQVKMLKGSRVIKYTVMTESGWQNSSDWYKDIKTVTGIRLPFTRQS